MLADQNKPKAELGLVFFYEKDELSATIEHYGIIHLYQMMPATTRSLKTTPVTMVDLLGELSQCGKARINKRTPLVDAACQDEVVYAKIMAIRRCTRPHTLYEAAGTVTIRATCQLGVFNIWFHPKTKPKNRSSELEFDFWFGLVGQPEF